MSFRSNGVAMLTAGCVACIGASGVAHAQDAPAALDKWNAWTEFGGSVGNQSEARRGEVAVWAPLSQDSRSLLFTDLRGRFFDEGETQGNFSLGYRYLGDNGWNPGFWLGLDRQYSSEAGSTINQFSFGFEALSPDWDLRLNGHLPLHHSEFVGSTVTGNATPTLEVADGTLLVVSGPVSNLSELAFWGADAEVGYRVPLELWGLGMFANAGFPGEEGGHSKRHSDLRLFLGGYYYENSDFDEEIAGPRLRAEWRIENILDDWDGSRLTFEAAYQYDDVRDNQLEAGLRLRIPLGGGAATLNDALSPQEQRMTEGLRGRDVVTRTKVTSTTPGATEPVEDAVTGVDFNSITFVQNGADMTAALAGAGGNALVVAFGGTTNFGPSVMVANQTLLGGGGRLQVRSRTTGLLYTYAAPGTRPTFQADQAPGITAADNAHIKSVNITGGAVGIQVAGPQRVVVDDATITGAVFGLSSNGSGSNLTVRNSFISGGSAGIVSGDVNQTLVLQNNVFDNLGTGVVIGDASGGLTSASFTVIGNTFTGAFTNYLLTFPNGTVNQMPGSVGNVDATTASLGICIRDFFMTLNGNTDFQGGGTASATTCAIP